MRKSPDKRMGRDVQLAMRMGMLCGGLGRCVVGWDGAASLAVEPVQLVMRPAKGVALKFSANDNFVVEHGIEFTIYDLRFTIWEPGASARRARAVGWLPRDTSE
jgi:hypothetical protein